MSKKPFYRVRYASYRKISNKACVIHCDDGTESILPLSRIIHQDNAVLIPSWLINKQREQGVFLPIGDRPVFHSGRDFARYYHE